MSDPQKVSKPSVEEDLDDLDDVLDQFSRPPVKEATLTQPSSSSTSIPAKAASKSETPSKAGAPSFDISEDFARELTMGMESLMREIASEAGLGDASVKPGGDGDGEPPSEEEKEHRRKLNAAWEAMLVEGMGGEMDADSVAAGKAPASASASGLSAGAGTKAEGFQASIQRAMEKLKESDANAQDAAANTTDSFESLISQLSQGISEGGGASDDDLKGLLDSMMSQLMSKDVLFDPLTELHEKLPSYLVEHAADITPEDKKRYDAQYTVVSKILTLYNDPAYSDENVEMTTQIIELMNEMQSHGAPPNDLMGPLPASMNVGTDGMPSLPDECPIA